MHARLVKNNDISKGSMLSAAQALHYVVSMITTDHGPLSDSSPSLLAHLTLLKLFKFFGFVCYLSDRDIHQLKGCVHTPPPTTLNFCKAIEYGAATAR